MSVLHKIYEWSKDLPDWQRDALRLVVSKSELSEADTERVASLLKIAMQIPVENAATATPLTEVDFPSTSTTGKAIALSQLTDLTDVNLIAPGQVLRFSPSGLTVIFGFNGAGKSGYSRVLKRACRARSEEPIILPNAFAPAANRVNATAKVTINVNGLSREISWTDGAETDSDLARVAVFDGKCARVYVAEDNEVAYLPYGLDVLTQFAELFDKVRRRLEIERMQFQDVPNQFSDLAGDTKVAQLMATLGDRTLEEIHTLANLTAEETLRAQAIGEALAQQNPEAIRIEKQNHVRLVQVLRNILNAGEAALSAEIIARLKASHSRLQVARKAAEAARAAFADDEDVLPGTGNDSWISLLKAAKQFSEEHAYPNHEFPCDSPDSRCVLCQQPLAEAAGRMKAFVDFLSKKANEELDSANRAQGLQAAKLKSFDPSTLLADSGTLEIMNSLSPTLVTSIRRSANELVRLKAKLEEMIAEELWQDVPPTVPVPTGEWDQYIVDRGAELSALTSLLADRKAVQFEFAELSARQALARRKAEVLIAKDRIRLRKAYSAAIGQLNTASITKKATALTNETVSTELEEALNDELLAVDMTHLQTSLQAKSTKGTTTHKLSFGAILPQGRTIDEVLSEGEHRAIGIAAFFAEMKLSGSPDPMVFDDPVSSLDHERRNRVAERIAIEARKRQIIVFTHDIVFLKQLESHAKALGTQCQFQSVSRSSSYAGYALDEPPFDAMGIAQRANLLGKSLAEAKRLDEAGLVSESKTKLREACTNRRKSWERAVEELLFNKVIDRFDFAVKTNSLAGVTVTDDDYKAVNTGMTTASLWEHDQPDAAQGPLTFSAFAKELDLLNAFIVRKKAEIKATNGLRR